MCNYYGENVSSELIIKSVDNSAFIILFDIKEVYGEEFKKL